MPKVQIAYVHKPEISHSFHHSMMNLMSSRSDNILPDTASVMGVTLGLVEARNNLMEYFLDKTDATHLFFIDTDMGFLPDTIDRLLEADLPVIGGLTTGNAVVGPDGMGGYITKPFPVAYDLVQNRDGLIHFAMKTDLNIAAQAPQQVAGTGTACLLISRQSAEQVRAQFGDIWFDQVGQTINGKTLRISEDLSFCYRLGAVAEPIYVHTGVPTTHAKMVWLQPTEWTDHISESSSRIIKENLEAAGIKVPKTW